MKHKDRKAKIELVLREARKANAFRDESATAWDRLCRELEHMVDPDARPPRFHGLLHALWIAASNDRT